MPAFRLRNFSDPQTLQGITPERLLRFLDPYRDFVQGRGCTLPPLGSETPPAIDYSRLATIFMSPDESTPTDLVHALILVDEMSFPEATEALLDAATKHGIPIDDGDDHTPADIAIQVWLGDREVLENKHAGQFLYRAKSFEYWRVEQDSVPDIAIPTPFVRTSLEHDLDDWFADHKRGRDSRVFVFPLGDDEMWFLVRHGEPFKREESIQGGVASSICYRPLKYDVVVYQRRRGELRINAKLVGEKNLYCEQFGKHLFPEGTSFKKKTYTLKPLIDMGVDALAFGDVEGIESITLTELHLLWGGGFSEVEIRKADDLFAAFAVREYELPESARPNKAVFSIKFNDCKKPRNVTVKCPSVVQYTRDTDAPVVERWLELRGFCESVRVPTNEPVAQTLVRT